MAAQLKLVIVGHVDHGKSTFIGRLLLDTGSLPDGKLEELEAIARRRGAALELANFTDAFQSERDQNVTIDTAQAWFRTPARDYVLIDAPGHREFLKNMVTGAAHADAACLVVDAAEGLREQSRRHAYLLHLLGLRHLVVLVNKMDLAGFDEAVFTARRTDRGSDAAAAGLSAVAIVPMAARDGDNVAAPSPHAVVDRPDCARRASRCPRRRRATLRSAAFPVQDVTASTIGGSSPDG
jgi:bifunctional enzyme CysN/CysC